MYGAFKIGERCPAICKSIRAGALRGVIIIRRGGVVLRHVNRIVGFRTNAHNEAMKILLAGCYRTVTDLDSNYAPANGKP